MEKKQMKIFISIIGLLIVGTIVSVLLQSGKGPVLPGEYDTFATCLKDKGTMFYGAFWCPHCQDQKEMFGSSAKLLPYTECSTLDGQGQNLICKEKGIGTYPTWIFADGTSVTGVLSFEALAEKTSCPLPSSDVSVEELPA